MGRWDGAWNVVLQLLEYCLHCKKTGRLKENFVIDWVLFQLRRRTSVLQLLECALIAGSWKGGYARILFTWIWLIFIMIIGAKWGKAKTVVMDDIILSFWHTRFLVPWESNHINNSVEFEGIEDVWQRQLNKSYTLLLHTKILENRHFKSVLCPFYYRSAILIGTNHHRKSIISNKMHQHKSYISSQKWLSKVVVRPFITFDENVAAILESMNLIFQKSLICRRTPSGEMHLLLL